MDVIKGKKMKPKIAFIAVIFVCMAGISAYWPMQRQSNMISHWVLKPEFGAYFVGYSGMFAVIEYPTVLCNVSSSIGWEIIRNGQNSAFQYPFNESINVFIFDPMHRYLNATFSFKIPSSSLENLEDWPTFYLRGDLIKLL
jgi:hypothetical protein